MKLLINIDVPSLEPAIHFYKDALGLRLTRQLDEGIAELSGASSTIYLLQHEAQTQATHNAGIYRHYTRHWTPVHIDFVVDNLNEAVERARAAGARQESECIEWRGSRCVTFSDPFGHGFCLIEFEVQSYLDDDTA